MNFLKLCSDKQIMNSKHNNHKELEHFTVYSGITQSKGLGLFLLPPTTQATFISEVSYVKYWAKQAKENGSNEYHESSWDSVASGYYPWPLDFCLWVVHFYPFLTKAKKINNLFLKLNTSIRSEMFINKSGCSVLPNYLTHVLLTELIFSRSLCSWEINLSPPVTLTLQIHIHLTLSPM